MKVLSVVLVLSLSLNAILILKRTEVFPTKKELYTENKELDQKVTRYGNELRKYKGLSAELDRAVQNAEQKINAKERQILAASREKRLTEKENQQLLAQIDSLQNRNLYLIDSLLVVQEENEVINSKINELEETIAGLNEKIGIAEALIADNIDVTPRKTNIFGNRNPTAMAKKVDELEVCFDILENRLAQSGKHNIYVVVTTPDAKVIVDGGGDAPTFEHPDHDKRAEYSKTESVQYENQTLNTCSSIQIPTNLKEGLYVVELFSEANKLGMTTFTLR